MRYSRRPHRGYGLRGLVYAGLASIGLLAILFLGSGGASAPASPNTQAKKPQQIMFYSEPTFITKNLADLTFLFTLPSYAEGRGYKVTRTTNFEDLTRGLKLREYSGMWLKMPPESDGKAFPVIKEFAENGGRVLMELSDSLCRNPDANASLTKNFSVSLECRDVDLVRDPYRLDKSQIPPLEETSVITTGLPRASLVLPDNCKPGNIESGNKELTATATCQSVKGEVILRVMHGKVGSVADNGFIAGNRDGVLKILEYLAGVMQ